MDKRQFLRGLSESQTFAADVRYVSASSSAAGAPHVNVNGPSASAQSSEPPFHDERAGAHFTEPGTGSDVTSRTSELTW